MKNELDDRITHFLAATKKMRKLSRKNRQLTKALKMQLRQAAGVVSIFDNAIQEAKDVARKEKLMEKKKRIVDKIKEDIDEFKSLLTMQSSLVYST